MATECAVTGRKLMPGDVVVGAVGVVVAVWQAWSEEQRAAFIAEHKKPAGKAAAKAAKDEVTNDGR